MTAGMNPHDCRRNQVSGQNLIPCTFATLLFPVTLLFSGWRQNPAERYSLLHGTRFVDRNRLGSPMSYNSKNVLFLGQASGILDTSRLHSAGEMVAFYFSGNNTWIIRTNENAKIGHFLRYRMSFWQKYKMELRDSLREFECSFNRNTSPRNLRLQLKPESAGTM